MRLALRVLDALESGGPDLQRTLSQRCAAFVERLNEFFEAESVPISADSFASIFRFRTTGAGEAFFDIAELACHPQRDVRGLGWFGFNTARKNIIMQNGRVRLHGFDDIDDMRQNFVIHLDELQCLLGNRFSSCLGCDCRF